MNPGLGIGSVVVCDSFAYGSKSKIGNWVCMGDHRLLKKAHEGNPNVSFPKEELDSIDLTRGQAKWVVEHKNTDPGTEEQGGGCSSDSTYFLARRLNDDGSYNPDGEEIAFSTNDDRRDSVSVKIVGKMKMIFVPIV